MRVVSFADVLQHEIKEKIPCFRGRLSKVYDYKSDTNDRGPWSIQNVEIVAPEGGGQRLRVKVWNREPVPKQWVGKVVELQAVEGEKGIKGLTVEQDTYKWQDGQPIKKQIEIQCGDGAGFYLLTEGQQTGHEPQNQPPPARQQAATAPQGQSRGQGAAQQPGASQRQPAAPPAENSQQQEQPPARQPKTPEERRAEKESGYRKSISDAAKFAARKVSGFRIVLKAMDELQKERQAIQRPLTADQFQGMCTSIFIAGDRSFQWEGLPMTSDDLEKFWPQPAQPANPPQSQSQQ